MSETTGTSYNYNYYVGVGVKVKIKKSELNALLSKYQLTLTNVKVNFDTAYLSKQFRVAINNALNQMGYANTTLGNMITQPKRQSHVNTSTPSLTEIEKQLGIDHSTIEKSYALYDDLGEMVKTVNTYALNADKSIKVTVDRFSNLIQTEIQEKTYATQSAEAFENAERRLRFLGSSGKLTAKQMSYFNNELASISELTGKEKINRLKQFNQELNLTGRRALSVSGQFQEALKKFMIWSTATVLITSLTKGIASVVRAIKSLDDAVVELNKVADLSDKELSSVLDRANQIAGRVISTADEAIRAVAQFKKAGYDLEESYNLAETAMIMVNVADGINSVESAASSLIAILKGFNMEATESTRVLDLLNHVSNNFAVDVDNLAEGMTRTSAVFAQTNTSLEETTAMLTATYEVLRNAETASQGLNTISQRLRKMTEDGEDNSEVIAKIEETFQKYTRGAVTMYDSNKELRSTYDVLADLHSVWDSLSSSAQAYVTEAVAGNRQNKVLMALMGNWATVEQVIAESANASGSALEENAKYADSVSGKLNKLKQAWNELAQATLNSDVIKFILEALTGLVKIMTKLGGLGSIIGSIGALIVALKLPAILKSVKTVTTALGLNKITTFQQAIAQNANTQAVQGNTTALLANASASDIAALKTAKLNKALLVIQIAITALVALVNVVKGVQSSLEEERQKEIEKIKEVSKASQERMNNFVKERDEYLKYSTILNQTVKDVQNLNNAEYKLAQTYGLTASKTEQANKSLEERKKKLQELFQIQRDEAKKTSEALEKELAQATRGQIVQGTVSPGWQQIFEESGVFEGATAENIQTMKNKLEALKLYENEDIFNLVSAISGFSNLPQIDLDNLKNEVPTLDEVIMGEGGSQVEALKTIDNEILRLKNLLGIGTTASTEATQAFEEIISSYTKLRETLVQTDFAYNALDDKLATLQKIQDEREEELKTEEKLKAVEEARLALAKAQSQYKRVLTEQGWQYVRDDEQIQTATEQLTKAIKDAGLDDLSQAINGIETLQDILSSMVGEEKDAMLAYYREANNLATWLDADWETKLKTLDRLLSNATGYKGSFTSDYFKNYGKSTKAGDMSPYIPSHHIGGIVGGIHTNPNEQISKLLKGEVVLTEPQQKKLLSVYQSKGGNIAISVGNISTKENNIDCANFISQIKAIGNLQVRTKRY